MKFLFSVYLGNYSYSLQGSSELIQLQFPCFFLFCRIQLQEKLPSGILKNFLQLQLHDLMALFQIKDVMIPKRLVVVGFKKHNQPPLTKGVNLHLS